MNCHDISTAAHPTSQPAAGSSATAASAWARSRSVTRRTRGDARRRQPRRSAGAKQPHFARQGEERHLPVHGRRAEPSGAVRQQAAAREVRRHAAAAPNCSRATAPRSSTRTRSCSGPKFKFAKHGQCGAELSELLPHLATVVDDIAIVKSMVTDAFNHAPGQILMNTGSQQFGRPSMGAWITYGLGSESQDLPGVRRASAPARRAPAAAIRNWGSGFLPTVYQGVPVPQRRRSGAVPVEPAGRRRASCSAIRSTRSRTLNQHAARRGGRSGDRHAHQLVRDGVPDAERARRS